MTGLFKLHETDSVTHNRLRQYSLPRNPLQIYSVSLMLINGSLFLLHLKLKSFLPFSCLISSMNIYLMSSSTWARQCGGLQANNGTKSHQTSTPDTYCQVRGWGGRGVGGGWGKYLVKIRSCVSSFYHLAPTQSPSNHYFSVSQSRDL